MNIAKFNGGLGDLTLCIDHFAKYDKVFIKSHQTDESIMQFLHLVSEALPAYVEIVDKLPNEGVQLAPTKPYSDVISALKEKLSVYAPIYKDSIILHPYGSKFANKYAHINGLPYKVISMDNIEKFVAKCPNNYILGTDEEITHLRIEGINTTPLSFEQQIAAALWGKELIAIDSFFKTIRLSTKTPTKVIIGDYPDPFRDIHFINPYDRDGILTPYYYKDIDKFDISLCLS